MNSSRHSLSEELFSHRQTLAAFLMLAAGIASGSAAIREIVDVASNLYNTLSVIRSGGLIAAATVFIILIALKVYQLLTGNLGRFLEGFIQHAVMRAIACSWLTTAIVLMILDEQIEGGNMLPTAFYTKLAIGMLLFSFGAAYLIITWIPADSD